MKQTDFLNGKAYLVWWQMSFQSKKELIGIFTTEELAWDCYNKYLMKLPHVIYQEYELDSECIDKEILEAIRK